MEPLNPKLEALGRAVAEASDRAATPERTLAAARVRLLSGRQRRGSPVVYVLSAAASLIVIALFVGLRLLGSGPDPARTPLSYVVGAAEQSGVVGEWLSADEEQVDLRFSEGSQLVVEPHGRARVAQITPYGATVVVEQGSLQARITSSARTAWTMRAGPFQVLVTGTEFRVAWEPTQQRFELTVSEGSVAVTGPHLPDDRRVVAGERLKVAVPAGQVELARGPALAPPAGLAAKELVGQPDLSAPQPGVVPSGEEPAMARSAANSDRAEADPETRSDDEVAWRGHLQAGRQREALAAAERQGFAGVLTQASPAELWQLVDAARFGGRPDRAVEVLQALRGRGVRGNTAFLLGKIAADQQGAPGRAITWFETYLNEAPTGALAEEALGRLMQLQRSSNPGAAAATAHRYLARFPRGTYSGLAKRLDSR